MMDDTDINQRIAAQVKRLRAAAGLSLDALALRCGVSRSMISLIERGQSSATAVVLERLAGGLGVPLAALFDGGAPAPSPLQRRAEQTAWTDPQSGYQRRNLTPPGCEAPLQLVEVLFPPGASVAYDSPPRAGLWQQLWLLEGTMEVAQGERSWRLEAGDCLAMDFSAPNRFHNPGRRPARYLVAIAGTAPDRPRSLP